MCPLLVDWKTLDFFLLQFYEQCLLRLRLLLVLLWWLLLRRVRRFRKFSNRKSASTLTKATASKQHIFYLCSVFCFMPNLLSNFLFLFHFFLIRFSSHDIGDGFLVVDQPAGKSLEKYHFGGIREDFFFLQRFDLHAVYMGKTLARRCSCASTVFWVFCSFFIFILFLLLVWLAFSLTFARQCTATTATSKW